MKSETLRRLQSAASPLIALLKEAEFSPHHKVTVTSNSIELTDGVFNIPNLEKKAPTTMKDLMSFTPPCKTTIPRMPSMMEPSVGFTPECDCKAPTFDQWYEANKEELFNELASEDPSLKLLAKYPDGVVSTHIKNILLMDAETAVENPQYRHNCGCIVCEANIRAYEHFNPST